MGVDEVGRGCLAGPVVAAAFYWEPKLEEKLQISGLLPFVRDSKTLSAKQREKVFSLLEANGTFSLGEASEQEIDVLNIQVASLRAMERAVEGLFARGVQVHDFLVDGKILSQKLRQWGAVAQVGADATCRAVSAASIVAKVHRDRRMDALGEQFPGYGFDVHKGYPTEAHRKALKSLGLSPHHRRSFAPCKQVQGRDLSQASV
jgi:ribonuclease HII